MNHKYLKLLIPVLLIFSSFSASAIELIKWERLPLAVPLLVGHERVIFIDRNVRVGVPDYLNGKLRVQSTGGSVYLLAQEAIAPTRLQLQDVETGALILLDIAALPPKAGDSPLEAIRIIEGENPTKLYGQKPPVQSETQANKPVRETPVPVVLTRFASQSLYAPLRTIEPVQGISRVSVDKKLDLKTLLPTLNIKASVMAAWQLEQQYVTAVLLRNTSTQPISLDPRLLNGNFIAATFQHEYLGPVGDSTDTTVVYLVTSKVGLNKSILPTISPINAQSNITQGVSNEK
ncbi:TIGR03749 family integrating conjugative element protein [Zophobihabitans entericus]|uniref:TIGR03749 family integrating conjugative element protein n=1 Tax=Zophobihabitans entericus TaxID=1635327 RepID=A0A6G9ICA5_9GAMM|nr:TIGR03749 family integrating conjugative element protein [Zophobihabitans entericus]QIQ21462.1 TIGR03749 family integrating conjugative element protein [Zophobihabitans entericus]